MFNQRVKQSQMLLQKALKGCKTYLPLIGINIKHSIYSLGEYLRVVFCYYRNIPFMKADFILTLSYLFHNPYRISKRFLEKHGDKNVYSYGETPLTTWETIVKTCEIAPGDVVYELGCGRGRTCFWLRYFVGCKTIGIEFIPEFVMIAEKTQQRFKTENLEFRLQDYFKANFSDATVIYLYGSTLSDEQIHNLVEIFSKLPPGTAIITVSYPLEDYCDQPLFEIMKRFPVEFPWGSTDVYLQYRK